MLKKLATLSTSRTQQIEIVVQRIASASQAIGLESAVGKMAGVKEVSPGMRVRVQVEALAGRQLEGHVVSVSQLPMQNFWSDVRYFVGLIKLDTGGNVLWAKQYLTHGDWELTSLAFQPSLGIHSPAHPTISGLLDPSLSSHFGRSVALAVWLAIGWFVVER